MNTLWSKIWADLWLYKGRTLLAIASIAAGVFSVGTLFGMIDMQLDKMDAAHRSSRPSHINLILRNDADAGMLQRIKAISGVSGTDILTQVTVRFKLRGDAAWRMGTLIARPDYAAQQFDITSLQAGRWPSASGIAMERLSADYNGSHVGDAVTFETATGEQTFKIEGMVRHSFIKPPRFGGQAHFFAAPEILPLFGAPKNSFRQVLAQIEPPYSSDTARTIARDIRMLLNRRDLGVNATLLQDPQQHWGRPFFAGINSVLQIMALASLALASVLMLNTISAHITQQTDQIGVMKSLGARKFTIVKLYLSEVLLIALAAIALAIPLSFGAAFVSSCWLLDLFNIDCGAFDFSARALLYMILGGLLVPMLAALGPVISGAALSVREAIASYGLGADFGSNRFDLCIERLGARFLPTLYAAALGNLFRRKARLLWTQSVLIIAGVMFLVTMSLIASVNLTLDNEMARSRYDVRLGFVQDQPTERIASLVKAVAKTQSVELWRRLPVEMDKNGQALRQKGSLGAQLLALPSASSMYRPYIESGRWLRPTDAGQRVAVISADTAVLNTLKPGDVINLGLGPPAQEWQIVGVYRWLAGSNYTVEPVYAPLETVQQLTRRKDQASFALLSAPIADLADEQAYVDALKQQCQDNGIKLDVYTTQAKLEQRQFARNQFRPVTSTLLGLAAMIASVGGIGLAGALAIGVLQRSREIGVLRAIGGPSRAIFRLFVLEGLLHGVIAWSLAVPLAYVAAGPLSFELGKTLFGLQLDYRFDVRAVWYWLGLVLMLAWIASYWPARKAARLTVRESLGH